MKTTEVHVWKFTRSAYEWSFISKFNLSAGKNAQIISVCLDAKSKVLFWCERRTTTQCCVCKCELNVNQKDIFGKGADILQNCPPVQIFLAGSSSVLLRPTANSPIGLTMFWSAACGRIQVWCWLSITPCLFWTWSNIDGSSLASTCMGKCNQSVVGKSLPKVLFTFPETPIVLMKIPWKSLEFLRFKDKQERKFVC